MSSSGERPFYGSKLCRTPTSCNGPLMPHSLAPRTAAWCRSTRSASSTGTRVATSGSRSTRPARSPASLASGPTGRRSGRSRREGETINDIYAFLTTEPNAEVGAIHPKAMPVILTTLDEVETWLTAPTPEAMKLQRPPADGSLKIVDHGMKEDNAGATQAG